MSTEFEQSGELRPGLFPEETAEEAVARIVAQNPQKHGVTVQERIERARAAVTRMVAAGVDFDSLSAEDALVIAIGGDPTEMMTGNKPRYTVDEEGNVKDHETGETHRRLTQGLGGHEAGMEEVHAGQAMVEGGNREDAAGGAAAGAKQDSPAGQPAEGAERPTSDPGGNEAGDGVAEADQPTRLADDARAETVGSVAVAACAHSWPEDPDEDTRCPACGLTFKAWVES